MLRRILLERIDEEERNGLNHIRPLEDPYLVGEEAASRARAERLERERYLGDEVLIREDRRWDWFLGKSFFRVVKYVFLYSFPAFPLSSFPLNTRPPSGA